MTDDLWRSELDMYQKYGVNVPVPQKPEFVPANKARFDSLISRAAQPVKPVQGTQQHSSGYSGKKTRSRKTVVTSAKPRGKSRQ